MSFLSKDTEFKELIMVRVNNKIQAGKKRIKYQQQSDIKNNKLQGGIGTFPTCQRRSTKFCRNKKLSNNIYI